MFSSSIIWFNECVYRRLPVLQAYKVGNQCWLATRPNLTLENSEERTFGLFDMVSPTEANHEEKVCKSVLSVHQKAAKVLLTT